MQPPTSESLTASLPANPLLPTESTLNEVARSFSCELTALDWLIGVNRFEDPETGLSSLSLQILLPSLFHRTTSVLCLDISSSCLGLSLSYSSALSLSILLSSTLKLLATDKCDCFMISTFAEQGSLQKPPSSFPSPIFAQSCVPISLTWLPSQGIRHPITSLSSIETAFPLCPSQPVAFSVPRIILP